MASSFAKSTHGQRWLRSKREILASNRADLSVDGVGREGVRRLRLFFVEFLNTLGRSMQLRQRVIATSTVYFKRFYLKHSFGTHDPRIVCPTLLCMASKVEETQVSLKRVIETLWTYYKPMYPPIDESTSVAGGESVASGSSTGSRLTARKSFVDVYREIIERMELIVCEALDFDLIVFHPYRPLSMLVESNPDIKPILPTAWAILNDSLRTDLCLEVAPALIAVAAIFIGQSVDHDNGDKYDAFLKRTGVPVETITKISRQIIDLYDSASTQENSDPSSRDLIQRFEDLKPILDKCVSHSLLVAARDEAKTANAQGSTQTCPQTRKRKTSTGKTRTRTRSRTPSGRGSDPSPPVRRAKRHKPHSQRESADGK